MNPSIPTPRSLPVGIEPAWPKPAGYPDELPDALALAEYVISVCADEVDEEFVESFFEGARATLVWKPLSEIAEGPKDNNIRDHGREKAYAKLPLRTMPPIVVEHGQVQDGNHRYRVARAQNAPGLWCYEVETID